MSVATKCSQCGAPADPGSNTCKYCGEPLPQPQVVQPQFAQQPPAPYGHQPVIVQPQMPAYHPSWPVKSKLAAGLLGIFLGGLGIHKFYLGKVGLGIVYILFSWTFIPAIIGFIEGIVYLSSSDHSFQVKNQVRVV